MTHYFLCGKRSPGKAETVRRIIMTDSTLRRESVGPIPPLITGPEFLPPPPNYPSYAQPPKKLTDEEILKYTQQAVYIIWLKNFAAEHPSFIKWYDERFIKLDN
jgi:hypothetical protein